MDEEKQEAVTIGSCASRESAKGVLKGMIQRTRNRLHHLEALQGMLPQELTLIQDNALWSLLIDMDRR